MASRRAVVGLLGIGVARAQSEPGTVTITRAQAEAAWKECDQQPFFKRNNEMHRIQCLQRKYSAQKVVIKN